MILASIAPVIVLGVLALGVVMVVVQKAQIRGARKRLAAQGFHVSSMHGGLLGSYVAVDRDSKRVALKGPRKGVGSTEEVYSLAAVQSVTSDPSNASVVELVIMPKMGSLHEYVITLDDRHVATDVINALGKHGVGASDGWGVAYVDDDDA